MSSRLTDEQFEAVGWAMDVAHSLVKAVTDSVGIHATRRDCLAKMLREHRDARPEQANTRYAAVREGLVELDMDGDTINQATVDNEDMYGFFLAFVGRRVKLTVEVIEP